MLRVFLHFDFHALSSCRKTVMDIVVTEGPAVQGIYQQVIRDYPSLIGASVAVWESKRR